MKQRLYRTMDRELRPLEMLPPLTLLKWMLAETLAGNFAPWSVLGRTLRFGWQVNRQQTILDRALARAERGDVDDDVPRLST